jgi:chain length determinant protein tyrosine kinase EpsG
VAFGAGVAGGQGGLAMARPFKVIAGELEGSAAEARAARPSAQRIGELLIELGKLSPEQVGLVLLEQGRRAKRFGELAVGLGFVTASDLDYALTHQRGVWTEQPIRDPEPANTVPIDDGRDGEARAAGPAVPHDEALRGVRSQLILRWFGADIEQHTLAVVSPGRGDGRSHVCANLALLIAQIEEQTLIIDADLRYPRMHTLFGLDNDVGLTSFLQRRVVRPPVRPVPGRPHLDLLTAGPLAADSHELIERRSFALLLEQLTQRYQYILIDTPAASAFGEALTIAIRSSGCVLVTRKHRTRLADVQTLATTLTGNSVEVLGAIINDV